MKVWTIIVFLLMGIFGYWFWNNYYSQKILVMEKVGDLHLRGLSRDELKRILDAYQKTRVVKLVLPDGRDKVFSLEDLGISIDIGDIWFQRNNPKFFFWEVTPKLRMLKSNLVVDTEEASVSASFSVALGKYVVNGQKKKYEASIGQIVEGIQDDFGKMEIYLTADFKETDDFVDKYSQINKSLDQVYSDQLVLKLKDGSDYFDLIIPKKVIVSSFDLQKLDMGELAINKDNLMGYVNDQISRVQRKDFNEAIAYENLSKELRDRFNLGESAGAVLGLDDGPTTDGNLADKYLEVDISQQKMYMFVEGRVFKEYKVSTGNYYPTPVGKFEIMNKAPKAYSAIFGVWMPYWMAFSYADDIGAYLGIHELPYVAGGGGEKIYRFGYYIGRKMTGGCVAMEPKDSKEIYDMSEVGEIVNIVP